MTPMSAEHLLQIIVTVWRAERSVKGSLGVQLLLLTMTWDSDLSYQTIPVSLLMDENNTASPKTPKDL